MSPTPLVAGQGCFVPEEPYSLVHCRGAQWGPGSVHTQRGTTGQKRWICDPSAELKDDPTDEIFLHLLEFPSLRERHKAQEVVSQEWQKAVLMFEAPAP